MGHEDATRARIDRNTLSPIGPHEGHRITNDARIELGPEQHPASARVHRLEEPVQCSIKDHVAGGRERATPHRKPFSDAPRLGAGCGVPGKEFTLTAGGNWCWLGSGAHERGAFDILHVQPLPGHAQPVARDVEEFRTRRESGGLLILAADQMRTNVRDRDSGPGLLGRDPLRDAGDQIDLGRPVRGLEIFRRPQHLAGPGVMDISEAVAVEADQHPAGHATDRQIDHDILVRSVKVVGVVRCDLISPDRLARAGPARENRGRPFVVARSRLMVPRPRVGGAVEQQIELRVVGKPHPHRAATNLPLIRWPAGRAEVCSLVLGIERPERVLDQHVGVRAGAERLPGKRAVAKVEAERRAAHAKLATAVADDYLVADDQRRDGHRFSDLDIANLVAPHLPTGHGVDRHHGGIEQRVNDEAIRMRRVPRENRAAIDDVATGLALGERVDLGIEHPFEPALVRDIKREQFVGERADHVHGVADDQRRAFMPCFDAGLELEFLRESRNIGRVDLRQRAETGPLDGAGRGRPIVAGGGRAGLCQDR